MRSRFPIIPPPPPCLTATFIFLTCFSSFLRANQHQYSSQSPLKLPKGPKRFFPSPVFPPVCSPSTCAWALSFPLVFLICALTSLLLSHILHFRVGFTPSLCIPGPPKYPTGIPVPVVPLTSLILRIERGNNLGWIL
jgi:hypothetical protein